MKLHTVNIIEYASDAVRGVSSYNDTPEGNKQAEIWFESCIKSSYPETTKKDIEACKDNGYFEQDDYQVFITHSN
jgi:hypothetical protein